MKRNKKKAGDVNISMTKIGKRRILKGNKRENKGSEYDGGENVSKQSRGGKVRPSEKHPGSSSEWDREMIPGVLLRKGHSPKHQGKSCRDMGGQKRTESEINCSISMDKQGMATERSQVTKHR